MPHAQDQTQKERVDPEFQQRSVKHGNLVVTLFQTSVLPWLGATLAPDQIAVSKLLISTPIERHPGHRRGDCGLDTGDVAIFDAAAADTRRLWEQYCG